MKNKIIEKNTFFNRFNIAIQRIGKSLMFPIAVLPIAALLNRFGSLFMDPNIGIQEQSIVWWIGKFLITPGDAVFSNLSLIFAIGVAFGLSKDFRGEAALSGVLAYFVITLLNGENMFPHIFYKEVLTSKINSGEEFSKLLYLISGDKTKSIYFFNTGVIGGIIAGLSSAFLYNKFHNIQLNDALSFFSGRRFVPMVTILFSIFLALIFAIVWPWLQYSLLSLGQWIQNTSGSNVKVSIAAGIYGFINRLMQPFGAHHILNTFLWFQMPITGESINPEITKLVKDVIIDGNKFTIYGDINAFAAGIKGSGIFQAGFFPTFFGGIPATGLAIVFTSDKSKRKEVITFIGGASLISFLTGIDEPIVFIWIFISPLLLIIHSILTSIFAFITVFLGIRIGFGFSAGLIDYLISLPKSWIFANGSIWANPLMIFPLSLIMAIIYFFIWKIIIIKFNLPTPGRDNNQFSSTKKIDVSSTNNKFHHMAQNIVDIIGKDNFLIVENCATRLRLVLKDNSNIDDLALKKLGIYQVIKIQKQQLQLIVGTNVEFVANELKKMVNN